MEVETEFDPALSTLAMPPAAQSRQVKRQNTGARPSRPWPA